jgi:PAS domain S-box-containing protein
MPAPAESHKSSNPPATQVSLASESRLFEALCAHLSDFISLIGAKSGLLRESESLRRLLRVPGGQTSGLHIHGRQIHSQDRENALEAIRLTLDDRQSRQITYRLMLPDGQIAKHEAGIEYVGQRDATEPIALVIAHEIRDQDKAAELMQERETLYRIVLEASPDLITLYSANGEVLYDNPAWTRLFGTAPLLNRRAGSLVHPDDRTRTSTSFSRLIAEGGSLTLEFRLLLPDGRSFWVEGAASTVNGPDGKGKWIIAMHRDINARKVAEAERAEIENRFRLLAEHSMDFITLLDRNGNSLYKSPSIKRFLDATDDDESSIAQIALPAYRSLLRDTFSNLVEHGGSATIEFQIQTSDEQIRWIEGRGVAIPGPNEQIQSVLTVERDITARKLAQAELAQSEERFRLLAENTADFIHLFSLSNDLIYDSPSFIQAAGPDYLHTRKAGHYIHPEDQHLVAEMSEAIQRDSEPKNAVLRYVFGERAPIWVQMSLTLARNEAGLPMMFVIVSHDISEIRQAEEKLRETQKLEAIGQLTGGLAHDFNNLLGIVLGNLDWISEHLPDDASLQRRIQSATRAAERGAEVTRSLLAVARRQPLEVLDHDLNELVTELIPLIEASAGSEIRIDTKLFEGELRVKLDAGRLSNAVLNMVINARDALTEVRRAKTIRVRTDRLFLDEPNAQGLPAGRYAALAISDNGMGMSESVRTRAFDPFYTTKPQGKGTGLGLAMVYGYVKQIGGIAQIESQENDGTVVSLLLPLI